MFEADGWGNHGWGEPAGKDGKPGYNTCHFWTNFGELASLSFLSFPARSPTTLLYLPLPSIRLRDLRIL